MIYFSILCHIITCLVVVAHCSPIRMRNVLFWPNEFGDDAQHSSASIIEICSFLVIIAILIIKTVSN